MCGIVYAQSFDGSPVGKRVWEQYEKQKSRGQQGFGVFDGQYTVKAAMEKRIKRWFNRDSAATMLLFHHRFPTSTVNVKRAAHPFNTGSHFGTTKYVLVHNGVVFNAKDLKPEHEKLGIKYQSVLQDGTFNDSEALLWDMALTLEGKQDAMKAYGGIAFICIKIVNEKPVTMFFGRNQGRPLNLERTPTGIMLSSEGPGDATETAQLYTYNYKLNRLTHKRFVIPAYKPYEPGDWEATRTKYLPAKAKSYYPYHSSRTPQGSDWDDEYDWDHQAIYDETKRYNQQIPSIKPTTIGQLLSIRPNDARVQALKMRLLNSNAGNYYHAITQAEAEYAAIDWIPEPNPTELREMAELLEVVDVISNDTGFKTVESIHPWWNKKTKEERANLSLALALNAAGGY